jgi:hypothetical protein
MLILSLLAMLSLTGCGDSKDEPAPPFKPKDVTPNSRLFASHEKSVGYVLWPEASIDDSMLKGEGYGYGYYYQHRAEAESFEEMMVMCQVPKSVLNAMSTRNLVVTCFKHPFTMNYFAYNDEYYGLMVTMTANCYQELMKRRSGRTELLDLLCDIKYGDPVSCRDSITFNSFEYFAVLLCMMTAVDCDVYEGTQIRQIANEVLNQIDDIIEYDSQHEGVRWYSMRYPYLLGAILAYHNDKELQESERELLYKFIGYQGDVSTNGEQILFSWEEVTHSTEVVIASLERLLD